QARRALQPAVLRRGAAAAAPADPQGLTRVNFGPSRLTFETARDHPAPFCFAVARCELPQLPCTNAGGDNDWLRLTGDDQREIGEWDGALQCVGSCWRR